MLKIIQNCYGIFISKENTRKNQARNRLWDLKFFRERKEKTGGGGDAEQMPNTAKTRTVRLVVAMPECEELSKKNLRCGKCVKCTKMCKMCHM